MKLKNEEKIRAKVSTINERLKNIDNLSLNELKLLYNDLIYNKTYFINDTFKQNIRIPKNIIKFICVLFYTYLMFIFGFNITIFLLFLFEVEGLRIFEDIMYGKESDNFKITLHNLEEEISNKILNTPSKEIKSPENKEIVLNSNHSLNNSMKLVRALKKRE